MNRLAEQIKSECAAHLNEGRQRIHKCLGMLDPERIWRRPNGHVVSVGNLILHLGGNVRQWIDTTLGGAPDDRDRDREFSEPGPIPKDELLSRLDRVLDRALAVIAGLSEEALVRPYRVQAYEMTGIGVLVHVTEHFSYHVGQITLHTKLMLDVDTGYYAGVDLNQRPVQAGPACS